MGQAHGAPEVSPSSAAASTEKFFNGELDVQTAFENAFNNDEHAVEELSRLVAELEAAGETQKQQMARLSAEAVQLLKKLAKAGDTNASEILRKIEQALEAQKRQQKVAAAAAQKGGDRADAWLQGKVEAGARELNTLEAEKHAAQQVAEAEAAKIAFKVAAMAEVEARDALRKKASEAAEIRLEEAEQALRYTQLKVEGLSALSAPAQPLVPGSEADEMPSLPPASSEGDARTASGPLPEFYDLLGVGIDATFEEIKRGYRRQALQWHPDKNQENLEVATDRFQRISEAFEVLFDPEKRTAYDAGKVDAQGRMKKLQGHGWSRSTDEDDSVLTPTGAKMKKLSWNRYVLEYGRLDDDPEVVTQIIANEEDPRAASEKMKLLWRYIGEEAYKERESGNKVWLGKFIRKVWRDTPTKWPGALELGTMSEASRQEWKERRMVYNRRKEKLLLNIDLHEEYLSIPDREQKEKERIFKRRYGDKAMNTVNIPQRKPATATYNPEQGCNQQ